MTRGLGLLCYGTEGVGKTSFALQAANYLGETHIISCKETGALDLLETNLDNFNKDNIKLVTETTRYEDVINGLAKPFPLTIIDGAGSSGLQQLLFDYVCRKDYNGTWEGKDGFNSYWKGQRVSSPPHLRQLMDKVDFYRSEGRHFIFIAHAIVERVTNELGADYLISAPDLDQGNTDGCRSVLTKWAQAILYMTIDINIATATKREQYTEVTLEGKAAQNTARIIYTTKGPGHSAKNRLGLPEIINMGKNSKEAFENFFKCLPAIYKQNV